MIQLSLSETERTGLQLQARREVGRVSERIHFVFLTG